MGMSTRVLAFRDMDGKFKNMLEVKEFCDARKVSYPEEVQAYFGYLSSDDTAETIKEELLLVSSEPWCKEYGNDYSVGFELEVKEIPSEVKTIRFVNSW